MNAQFIAAAQHWLSTGARLSAARADALAGTAAQLVSALPRARPLVIGVSGAPGTGKSTLALACAHGFRAAGATPVVLALDDYYLAQEERKALAREIHPLLQQRGPPGTHDLDLLTSHVEKLRSGTVLRLSLPQFDKSRDERLPKPRKIRLPSAPSHILVEGWCVKVPPQNDSELDAAVNELESVQDPDGAWRRWTNARLREYHRALEPLVDVHWHLEAPGWEQVVAWRWRQEQQRRMRWLQSRQEIRGFLAVYERICGHMHRNASQWADAIVTLDADHFPHTRQRA